MECISYTYTRIHSPPIRLPSRLPHNMSRAPCAVGRSLLVIHLEYCSVQVFILNSLTLSSPILHPPARNHNIQGLSYGNRAFVDAKLLHLCLTLCDPMDCSPPGPSVHGDSPARILEWVAMPSSRGSFLPSDQT